MFLIAINMRKISFLFALLLGLSCFSRAYSQYVLNSTSPTPFIVPIGGSATGSFVVTLVGNSLSEGLAGASFQIGFQGTATYGMTISSASVSTNPNTGVPIVFGPDGSGGQLALDFTNYPVGTQFTITYTVTSDGTGAVGDQAPIALRIGDFASGTSFEVDSKSVALPVTLVSFTAVKEGNSASLNWKTTEETNSGYFEVQHSTNSKTWAKVGEVPSANAGKTLQTYSFTHTEIASNTNYYRLKMVDLDGTFTYSKIAKVDMGDLPDLISFGPNPASDFLTIRSSNWAEIKLITLANNSGGVVYSSGLESKPEATINVSKLSPGIYVLQIVKTNGEIASKKIALSR